jgi:hypothetical protein
MFSGTLKGAETEMQVKALGAGAADHTDTDTATE